MNENETKEFFALLDQACEALGKPAKSMGAKVMFVELLGGYGFKNLRGAVMAHLNDPDRGRFPPAPADLKAQIEKALENDGRPTSDEAFSIAIQLQDESATVVSTEEISAAWGIARDIMPDRTGARMAFRSAYERLCAESRTKGKPVQWFPSLGMDPLAREGALKQAVELGRLPNEHIQQFLPAPEPKKEVVALIETAQTSDKAKAAQALAELKKKLGVK
jgi:hypothetical protein